VNSYIYNDEDNAPMNDAVVNESNFDRNGHNPTVYQSAYEARMYDKYGEPVPFNDPPEDGCWNCLNFDYNHEACTVNWNNLDESYYNPDTDDRNPTDYCKDHEKDEDAVWEDWFGDGTDT